MTPTTCDAIFENGVFRPVGGPLADVAEGQRVRLVVEPTGGSVLDLAAEVYGDLTEEQVDEIEQIALDRKPFFDRTNG